MQKQYRLLKLKHQINGMILKRAILILMRIRTVTVNKLKGFAAWGILVKNDTWLSLGSFIYL